MANDLEVALDGLQDAEGYCEANGLDDLAEQIASLYQDLGKQAPEGEWDGDSDE